MQLMSLREHQDATDLTARYPAAGTGTTAALAYVALGLAGESSEVLEKHAARDRAGVCAELGDVLWYLARFQREMNLVPATPAQPIPGPHLDRDRAVNDLVIAAGRCAEIVKKALRDDGGTLTHDRRDALSVELTRVGLAWTAVVDAYSLNPYVVAGNNIAKLLDRRDRNVLAGSGDHR